MNRITRVNKLLLTSASVVAIGFATSALAAGSTSTYLKQTGNDQTAKIHQDGGTGDTVGSYNNPFLQENGGGSGGNILVINQNAKTDSVLANIGSLYSPGSNNSLTGYQSGTDNNAEVDQQGSNSNVSLQQTGANNGAPNPTTGTWFNDTPGNLILQDKTANGSSVSLTQTNSVSAAKGSVFSIAQGGSGNNVAVTQTAQTAHNDVWIRQGTTKPDLWSWTYGDYFSPTKTPNSLSALSNSTITVNQSIGGDHPNRANYAALGQGHGSGNHLTVTQTGASNTADANQVGSNNTFNSSQSSSNSNTAWNFVGGEAGWPNIANPLNGSTGDYGPITQSGNGNQYYIVQQGTNEGAFGNQTGNNNYLNSLQTGDENALYSTQNGDNNQIYSVQDGSTNYAMVSQNHSSSLVSFTQSGAGNSATITQ